MTKKEEKALQEKAKEILEQRAKERKIIRLHHHPDGIKQAIKDLKEWATDDDTKNLFEDIDILVNWALDRLPIVPPKKKEEGLEN